VQDGKQKGRGLGGLPFPPASPHIHEQSALKRGSAKGCAGASLTRRCQYTMYIYAHAAREAKRTSARLLDKVVGGE